MVRDVAQGIRLLGPSLLEARARPDRATAARGRPARRRPAGRRTGARPAGRARRGPARAVAEVEAVQVDRRPHQALQGRAGQQDLRAGEPTPIRLTSRTSGCDRTRPAPSPGPASGRPATRGCRCRSATVPGRCRAKADGSTDSPTNSGSNPTTLWPRSSSARTSGVGSPSGVASPALPRGWTITVSRPVHPSGSGGRPGSTRRPPCGRCAVDDRHPLAGHLAHLCLREVRQGRIDQADADLQAREQFGARRLPGRRRRRVPERLELAPHRADQVGLELRGGLAGRRARVLGVVDEQVLGLLGVCVALAGASRVVDAEQPGGQERVDGVAAGLVVVVRDFEDLGARRGRGADQRVDGADAPGRRGSSSGRSRRRWRRRASSAGGRSARRSRCCRSRCAAPRRSRRAAPLASSARPCRPAPRPRPGRRPPPAGTSASPPPTRPCSRSAPGRRRAAT